MYLIKWSNFNPIIVLFLTSNNHLEIVINENFNPIIVLFLTLNLSCPFSTTGKFQSYYSLISNKEEILRQIDHISNFNPIIVLFLTQPVSL